MTTQRSAAEGLSLLDAIGQLVAFTPASAKHYLAEHPDDAAKIKGLVGSANVVMEALTDVLSAFTPKERRAEQLAVALADVLNEDGVETAIEVLHEAMPNYQFRELVTVATSHGRRRSS